MKYELTIKEDSEAMLNIHLNAYELWECIDDTRDRLRDDLKYGNTLDKDALYRDICEILDKYAL